MGYILPDLARTEDDFDKCRELVRKLEPGGVIAPIGYPGNSSYIIRDQDDRSVIHAMIHAETAVEVRHMLVDPQYEHSQVSFTLLHRSMEMIFRASGVQQYFFTVNPKNKRVIAAFEKDGAQVIDTGMVRFLRRL